MSAVAMLIIPGEEDPRVLMKTGKHPVLWSSTDGTTRQVTRFQEKPLARVVANRVLLPNLYCQSLDSRFLVSDREVDSAVRAGNDNAEVRVVLPGKYVRGEASLEGDLGRKLRLVLDFLVAQGEVPVSANSCANSSRRIFYLAAARPKVSVTFPKNPFGIPESADVYLFAKAHRSVPFMDEEEAEAFAACAQELALVESLDLRLLAVFLKVFLEGGLAYNQKVRIDQRNFKPKNVGIAALSVDRAFEGQKGILTGFPYAVDARFLPFVDTVPVSIPSIREMSSRHARYSLCFSRSVFVWEGDQFSSDGVLDFCCLVPHGGLYFVPSTLKEHRQHGSLVYAFEGEGADIDGVPLEAEF